MEIDIFNKFLAAISKRKDADSISIEGRWRTTIVRADGSEEQSDWINKQMLAEGLNQIADLMVTAAASPFAYLSVGTVTAAASLGSTITDFGEVSRKIGAVNSASAEVAYCIATWGGDADSVTSLVLESAAWVNHANSGEGVAADIVNGVAATLADSDHLHLEVQIQVGSHNI